VAAMTDSILTSVKKVLGLAEDYEIFDLDVIMHINTALGTLAQLGIGPEDGFMIEDKAATWGDFLLDNGNRYLLQGVQTYICLRVRLIFDPPATSFAIDSFQKQIQELEWRLNVVREDTDWVDPNPVPSRGPLVIDGGDDG
jgi:hypothetical protein